MPTDETLLHRAEFYLCLSRTFLAPRDEAWLRSFRDDLPDDLAELSAALGEPPQQALDALRRETRALPDAAALLQLYSALFLAPPRRAELNAGLYLDGAVMGQSVLEMQRRYARLGVQRAEDFRDLPDHVATQLEFLGLAFSRAAQGDEAAAREGFAFAADFVRHWAPALRAALEGAHAEGIDPGPYLPLARILEQAAARDAGAAQAAESAGRP